MNQVWTCAAPAAFRRLCVETALWAKLEALDGQPPSGGCVLKQQSQHQVRRPLLPAAFRRLCVETSTDTATKGKGNDQPPSGGCVLKLAHLLDVFFKHFQPPSGGCVLKLNYLILKKKIYNPAAFRRLCVETLT